MLLTILTCVRVPEDADGKKDGDALLTYVWLCIAHLVLFAQITANHYYNWLGPMFFSAANVILMLFQVVT